MPKIVLFICLLFSVFSADAQNGRFVYSDSLSTMGVFPVKREIIQRNHIKYADLYYVDVTGKDSTFLKRFVFDSSGNAVKQILFGRNKLGYTTDSIIYDNQNRPLKFFIFSQRNIIGSDSLEYSGDSVIKTNSAYYMTYKKKVDTTYSIQYLNPDKQIQSFTYFDVNNQKKSVTKYTYTDQGLPATLEFTDFENPRSSGYGYRYEHQFSKKGRKMILWDSHANTKVKREECFYNKSGQTIQCITYDNRAGGNNYYNKYRYNPDGTLFEEIFESTPGPYNSKPFTRISHFYYFQ